MTWWILTIGGWVVAAIAMAGYYGARRRAELAEKSFQSEYRSHEATKMWLRLNQRNRLRTERELMLQQSYGAKQL